MKPQDLKVLVVGWNQYWAKADTLAEALKNANRPKYYKAYVVHPDSAINSMGWITFPSGFEPKVIVDRQP